MKNRNKAGGSEAVRPVDTLEHVVLTADELDVACGWWQRRLRLQDWEIILSLVREREIDGNLGRIKVNEAWKCARIAIATHDDYDVEDYPNDMEHSLVHELLHLLFWGCDVDGTTDQGTAEEQAINILATALVELARGERGHQEWSPK